MIAVISDVHGNLPALAAVIHDIEKRGIQRVICLGDLVGYGAQPAECVDLVMKKCEACIKGNHDDAVFFLHIGINMVARRALEWTINVLKPGWFSSAMKKKRWEYLKHLPPFLEMDDMLFVHGSPRDPTFEYIMEEDTISMVGGVSEKIRDNFARFKRLCFLGHTHRPGIVTETGEFLSPRDIDGKFLTGSEKLMINVGSVGQPRDEDPRACYLALDKNVVEFHRVEYDIDAAAEKIRAVPNLDDRLADRLYRGK